MILPKSTNLKPPTNSELGKWYDDSLSLVTSKSLNSGKQPILTTSPIMMLGIGLMAFKNKSDVFWKYGEYDKCVSFIENQNYEELGNHTCNNVIEPFLDGLIIAGKIEETTRVVYLDGIALTKILVQFLGHITLSKSELNLLIQILCGMTLKEAAITDNVTYETKRSQFKSLAARTGFHTQSEVIRNTLSCLMTYVMELFHTFYTGASHHGDEAWKFLNSYYPGIFRYHQIEMNDGQKLRVADTGPIGGDPVIWLHSQTLPCPKQLSNDWPLERNIRLLIPLREGFLEETDTRYSKAGHIDRCTNDLVAVVKHFCGGKARVVANSTGVPYAINMAVKFPEHVEHITFCASSYLGHYHNQPVRKLVNGVKNLVTKNELLIARMFERYLSKMSSLAGILEVLESSYKDSNWDMEVFTALLSNPVNHSWMYESYRKSRHSVVMDVAMGGYDVWKNAEKIGCGTLFVHGKLDPINLATDAQLIAGHIPHSEFVLLEEDGQSLFLTKLSEITGMSKQSRR